MIRHLAGAPAAPAGDYAADVIILALHRVDDTLDAIASALAQRGVSRHVHVLDQGSTPAERDRLAAAIAGRTDATLYGAAVNLGVGGGRNALAALGHGRVIAGLDNDAVFADAATLGRMVAALDDAPGVAAIGCRILAHATGADDWSSWGYPAALRPRADECFPAVTFVGAGHAIRRAAWDAAGGYDPVLFFCWEEYDFCLRAIALGWRIDYRGDIAVRHKVAAEQRVSWSGSRWFHFVRNRLHIERKHGATWPALSPRVAGYLLKGFRHGLGRETLRAIAAARAMTVQRAQPTLAGSARAYLLAHDRAHRGFWHQRLRTEVLGGFGSAPNRSRSSRPNTAGLSRR
jgi:GT2 family glycosyltransferase